MRRQTYPRIVTRAADPVAVDPSLWDSGPLVDGGDRRYCCRSDLHALHLLLVVGRRLTSEPVSIYLRTLRSGSQRGLRSAANRLGAG